METRIRIRSEHVTRFRVLRLSALCRMFQEIYHSLLFGDGGGMADPYFVLKDLSSYINTQKQMMRDYDNRDLWLHKAVMNTACSSLFTSDRTIEEYNKLIWHLKPLKL